MLPCSRLASAARRRASSRLLASGSSASSAAFAAPSLRPSASVSSSPFRPTSRLFFRPSPFLAAGGEKGLVEYETIQREVLSQVQAADVVKNLIKPHYDSFVANGEPSCEVCGEEDTHRSAECPDAERKNFLLKHLACKACDQTGHFFHACPARENHAGKIRHIRCDEDFRETVLYAKNTELMLAVHWITPHCGASMALAEFLVERAEDSPDVIFCSLDWDSPHLELARNHCDVEKRTNSFLWFWRGRIIGHMRGCPPSEWAEAHAAMRSRHYSEGLDAFGRQERYWSQDAPSDWILRSRQQLAF
eukprot:NODE_2382_length_1134_cov_6.851613_g1979_i0.p1 GENE.NODE_2382_length_1134_cov_6.851613_g1979_i0~~NODE_2382_length_1134_cov_6.851613_g1979_i0.p1  ORF type:complete len:341 (-),score=32.54 NODE_2382_length_1134_cov_6.851613_g1979_i0:110-1024(-)